jgi:hypothetical protein
MVVLLTGDFNSSQLFVNNSSVGSVDITTDITDKAEMGATMSEYDNDGDLDWFVFLLFVIAIANNVNFQLIAVIDDTQIKIGRLCRCH